MAPVVAVPVASPGAVQSRHREGTAVAGCCQPRLARSPRNLHRHRTGSWREGCRRRVLGRDRGGASADSRRGGQRAGRTCGGAAMRGAGARSATTRDPLGSGTHRGPSARDVAQHRDAAERSCHSSTDADAEKLRTALALVKSQQPEGERHFHLPPFCALAASLKVSMSRRVSRASVVVGLWISSAAALHGQAPDPPTLYMPDGQLASHSIRIYVTRDIPAAAKPKLQLFGDNGVIKAPNGRTDGLWEPRLVAPGQAWLQPDAYGQTEVPRDGSCSSRASSKVRSGTCRGNWSPSWGSARPVIWRRSWRSRNEPGHPVICAHDGRGKRNSIHRFKLFDRSKNRSILTTGRHPPRNTQ